MKYPQDWTIKSIGELKFEIGDGNYSSLYPKSSEFTDTGVLFFTANSIQRNKLTTNGARFISEAKNSILKKGQLKKGDILLSTRGDIGKTALVPDEFVGQNINAQLVRLNPLDKMDSSYLWQYLSSPWIKSKIESFQTGSALKQLPIGNLKKIEILFPPLEEQRKIVQVLSSWDETIEAVEELIEKKKNQKKVLSEELFSGSRRLVVDSTKTQETKYGNIPADWDFLPISKIAKINRKSLGNNTQYKSYKYIDLSSVSEGVISFPEEEITPDELPSRARRIIQKGDVIFSTVRPNLLGYAIVDFDTSNHLCSTGFAVITPNAESDTNFIYQQLYSTLFQRQVFSKVTGSNYPAVNSSDFNNVKLSWPSNKNERKEIGDLLSGIELEVQLLYKKRKLLQKQKTGLMQQLLTGKVRFT